MNYYKIPNPEFNKQFRNSNNDTLRSDCQEDVDELNVHFKEDFISILDILLNRNKLPGFFCRF